jgi:hypothetical protein
MSSLLVFNRVYRREIESVMLVFLTDFVNYCPGGPGYILSGCLSPPPLPCVNITINVPVVFVARYVMVLRRATSLRGALEGVGRSAFIVVNYICLTSLFLFLLLKHEEKKSEFIRNFYPNFYCFTKNPIYEYNLY